jgi:hypothetical protein
MSEPQEYQPRCINLYCKSMMVYGEDFESDPDYQQGQTEFWCLCTSRNQGPDGNGVSLSACRSRERSCYQEF